MSELWTTSSLIALLTLTALEIVLGIDNVIFLAIISARLPREERRKARVIGLALALLARVALLLGITWVMGLKRDLFVVLGQGISGKDLILLAGGGFLIAKSTLEIHKKVEHDEHGEGGSSAKPAGFFSVVSQIIVIDLVFSLDSVITAVGMVDQVVIMIAAVIVAIGVMMVFAGVIGDFIERNPALKVLALAFLILIGVMLTAEGLGQHVNKGYIYFAMAFSLGVELLNMRRRKRHVMPSPVPPASSST
jgi:predicted tellurium resistance membrane protein TerC